MRSVAPRPVVIRVHKTWSITPGMSFSVVEDIDRKVWIVEACPAGSQYWNLGQAAMLTGGDKTGDPLEAAIAHATALQARLSARAAKKRQSVRIGMPEGALKGSRPTRTVSSARSSRELVTI